MLKKLLKSQEGLSLSMMIALGFGAAVLLIIIVAIIVYFAKS